MQPSQNVNCVFLLLKFTDSLDKPVDENYMASQFPTIDQKAGIEQERDDQWLVKCILDGIFS